MVPSRPPACPSCTALKAELAALRRKLGEETTPGRIARLSAGFGVSATVAILIDRLAQAEGALVRPEALLYAMRRDARDVDRSWLFVYVRRARAVLGNGTIENVRYLGFRLTQAGAEVVARVLAGADPPPRRVV